MRQTVGAYREVTLAGELAGARTALVAAGIAADLPTAVPELPAERDELFGWAVREGVTNVVRHSGARRCAIRVDPDGVEVRDDGRGPSTPDVRAAGHGLVGPARAGAAAGRHGERRSPSGGLRLPAAGPPAGGDPVSAPIRLLLADDQALVRGALAALLSLEPDLTVVAEVGRGDEVVPEARRTTPGRGPARRGDARAGRDRRRRRAARPRCRPAGC